MQITAQLITIIGTSLVTVGGMVPVLKKYLPRVGEVIKQDAPVIAHDVNIGIDFLKNLAESPLFAGKVAAGKLEAHHVISELEKSQLVIASVKGIGAFTKTLGVPLSGMTATQKTDLTEFVKAELAKVGVTMTDAQIVQALQDAQTVYTIIEQTVMPTVQQHDAAVAAWKQVEQPAPAPAQLQSVQA